MTWIMGFVRPSALLVVMALLGTLLCVYAVVSPNISGVWAIVGISASLSLMFPTIYGISLHGLGADAKIGAAGLVMAILGGAVMPLVFGAVMDAYDAATGYLVPAICFLIVALYAGFDLMSKSRFADNPQGA
jgi:FHS family L-fucose permease-like MFS transporter